MDYKRCYHLDFFGVTGMLATGCVVMGQPPEVIGHYVKDFDKQLEAMKKKMEEERVVSYKKATSEEGQAELERRFNYHAPEDYQLEHYKEVRRLAKELAYGLMVMCPESREASLALTHLEQAVFWANAAIARNPEEAGP